MPSEAVPEQTQHTLLVFYLADQLAALRLSDVGSVAPMAHLAQPPGLPAALEGILNLAGEAVPVWRPERLFRLPERPAGLYSLLVVLKAAAGCRTAMLVNRVSGIQSVPASALLPVEARDTFNGCAEAEVATGGRVIHLLSAARIFLAQEQAALGEFQALARQRLQGWEPAGEARSSS